jgi:hypothetical protein
VFWLNAVSEATLKDSFRVATEAVSDVQDAQMLQDRHALVKTRRWLSDKKNTWWLLIFDNYDDPDQYPIEQYCPYVFHGAVIVTTRRADLVAGRPFGCSLSTAWKTVSRSWKRDLGERMLDLVGRPVAPRVPELVY